MHAKVPTPIATIALSIGVAASGYLVYLFTQLDALDTYTPAAVNRAAVYLSLAREQIAIEEDQSLSDLYYRKAGTVDPQNPEILYERARLQIAQQNFNSAIKTAETFLNAYPQSAPMYYVAGIASALGGDLEQAATLLGQALSLNGQSTPTKTDLAWVLARQGKLDEAENLLREAYTVTPENMWALVSLAGIDIAKGNVIEAKKLLLDARAVYAKVPEHAWKNVFAFDAGEHVFTYRDAVLQAIDANEALLQSKKTIAPPRGIAVAEVAHEGRKGYVVMSMTGVCGPVKCESAVNQCGQKTQWVVNSCVSQTCEATAKDHPAPKPTCEIPPNDVVTPM